jgi:hypothetical protein
MATIIAVWHESNKGKSETLREFALLLLSRYPRYKAIEPVPALVPSKYDFRLIVKIKGKVIGIESQGDPGTGLKERLEDLAYKKFKCDIILCTTRTKGYTIEAVDNLWRTKGFDVIWTSTYQIGDTSLHRRVNRLKAKHILELIHNLGLI